MIENLIVLLAALTIIGVLFLIGEAIAWLFSAPPQEHRRW